MSIGDTPDASNPYRSPSEVASRPPAATPSLRTADLLRQTRPWVRFMGILGFVAVALMFAIGAVMLVIGIVGVSAGNVPAGQFIAMGVMYPIMSLLYIFPSLFLLRYASRISTFLDDGATESLDLALEAQKSFWKFVGIMTAIVVALYGVIILFALVGGLIAWVASSR